MKKFAILSLVFFLFCVGCTAPVQDTELTVFAAASLQEALDAAIAAYDVPGVTVRAAYDSSGTLKRQIMEGAFCHVFISAAPGQMDEVEKAGHLLPGSRRALLENRVVLAAPEDAQGMTFSALPQLLQNGSILLAVGNSDVPAGQYARKIFNHLGIDTKTVSQSLTYGSNVREVTTQVQQGLAHCGIVYATDAGIAGLYAWDEATEEMCGKVIYPAAVIDSDLSRQAEAFLDYLQNPAAMAYFADAGFIPVK